MNTMFAYNNFLLNDFPRAVAIARSYQQYRISGITLRLKPDFTVFNLGLGAPAPAQQPYLYYMLDKSGSIPNTITLEGLKQMGARPMKFSTNTRTITWKPTALVEMYAGPNAISPASFKSTPWLSTNATPLDATWTPSVVPHQGLKWYIEEGNGVAYAVDIDVELQFQFRKPLVIANANTPASGLAYAVLDASPDGIEGGSDGISIPLTH